MSIATFSLVFYLLLVEVYSQQTYPYVSFMSQTLPNHSYVDITRVGVDSSDSSDSVQCITDLGTCCTAISSQGGQGIHRGDWHFPNGSRLPFSGGIYEHRDAQRVDLRRDGNANSPTGIYRCDIATNAVHDNTDILVRDTVYVGLYTSSGGDVTISGDVMYDSDQMTLTCISTGGPATTVTWTRYSTILTEGTETVFNDPVTAQYTHTLTISTIGVYTCTVSNNKPSSAAASITIEGASPPTDVRAVQNSATSIAVTWTPPSPLEDITGYRIFYAAAGGGGSSGSKNVSGGSTSSDTLSGLTNGEIYTISVSSIGTNVLPSSPVPAAMSVSLVPVPGHVNVLVRSITATSISLLWSVSYGSVSSWEVVWRRETYGWTERFSGSLPGTSYTIDQLDSTTIYTVRVIATNVAGTTTSNTLFISTSGSECDGEIERIAIIGGVVAIAIVLILTLVVVVLVLRSRSRGSTSVTKRRDPVDVPASTNSQSLELTKFPEPTYEDPDQFQTTSNEAYNIVGGTGGTGVDEDYEITIPPPPPPPTSSSSQSATTGHEEDEPV